MKSFIVFALCVAAVAANLIIPVPVTDEAAEIQQIIAAINHPSTDPATAAALEQMLNELLGNKPEYEPIQVGPAIIDPTPIHVGPAIVESEAEFEPISVGPAIIDPSIVPPQAESSPLVQIIINVNSGADVGPAIIDPVQVDPTPVIIVDQPTGDFEPINVGPAIIDPVQVEPTPVIIVDKPQAVEPVIVAPIIVPEPVVVLPGILN